MTIKPKNIKPRTNIVYIDINNLRRKGRDAVPIMFGYLRDDGKLQCTNDAREIYIDGPCRVVFSPGKEIEMGGVEAWIETPSRIMVVTEAEMTKVR